MRHSRQNTQRYNSRRTGDYSGKREAKREKHSPDRNGCHNKKRQYGVSRNKVRHRSGSSDRRSPSPVLSRSRAQIMQKSRKQSKRRSESRHYRAIRHSSSASRSQSRSRSRKRSRSYSHGSRRTRRDMSTCERSRSDSRGRRRFKPHIRSISSPSRSQSYYNRFRSNSTLSSRSEVSWQRDTRSRSNRVHRRSRSRRRDDGSKDDSDDSGTHDDTIGLYKGKAGDYIAARYKIIREAGLGTFGRVLECIDKQRGRIVAIKVVRKVEKYSDSAKIEARILQDVNSKDSKNQSLCVRMYKWFQHQGHVCMVFERLGCSLYEYLKSHDYKPFPIEYIRAVAWQLLAALDYIHSMKLIHTDLKPENILLVDDREKQTGQSSSTSSTLACDDTALQSTRTDQEKKALKRSQQNRSRASGSEVNQTGRETLIEPEFNAIKLIDFGGATYDNEPKSSIINTRQYRSPEVILGLGWSYPSDIWSAGCIVAELYRGDLLFATHDNMEHLALIEACVGQLPSKIVTAALRKQSAKSFFSGNRLAWPKNAPNSESYNHVKRMQTLRQIVSTEDAKLGFLNLLEQMLVLDPKNRISARQAMAHPFFKGFSRKDITQPSPNDSAGYLSSLLKTS